MIKTFVLSILTVSLHASLLTYPVLSPDGQPLNPLDPQLGAQIYAIPGSIWEVYFNDNYMNSGPGVNGGDFDFNDAVLVVNFGLPGSVSLDYFASVSGDVQYIGYSPNPILSVGQRDKYPVAQNGAVFTVFDYVPIIDHTYITGPASWNPDSTVHAFVQRLDVSSETPEPMTWLYCLIGFLCLALYVSVKGIRE